DRALARAARTDESDALARLDRERHPLERTPLGSARIREAHAPELDAPTRPRESARAGGLDDGRARLEELADALRRSSGRLERAPERAQRADRSGDAQRVE